MELEIEPQVLGCKVTIPQGRPLVTALEKSLAASNMQFYHDDKLLFWEQHFDGSDWATYANGSKKGGTLRYRPNAIRIPSFSPLPVYETNEEKIGKGPRALVTIPRIVVCEAGALGLEELAADGFESHEQMIRDMRAYYPDITQNSVVSFYWFGDTKWD